MPCRDDFRSYFEAEYPESGFGITRLIPTFSGQISLKLFDAGYIQVGPDLLSSFLQTSDGYLVMSGSAAGIRRRTEVNADVNSKSDLKKQEYETPDASVSLVRLKQLAIEMLPAASHLRGLIMSEPDSLPRELAVAKVEVFSRLLYKELAKP